MSLNINFDNTQIFFRVFSKTKNKIISEKYDCKLLPNLPKDEELFLDLLTGCYIGNEPLYLNDIIKLRHKETKEIKIGKISSK
jgi:hypothetical protein